MISRNNLLRSCMVGVVLFLSVGGCANTGIRNLTEVETRYFDTLQRDVKKSSRKIDTLLNKYTAVNEEIALREVARLEDMIRQASLVYSVREVLTAPESDRSEFIQMTRNKVILYHLAQASQAQQAKLSAQLEIRRQQRKQLMILHQEIAKLVKDTIESNKVLQNHVNKAVSAQLVDVLAEVGRQVTAFNKGLQQADHSNPMIRKFVKVGDLAEKQMAQADERLTKFIGVWQKLNSQKE